MKPKTILQKRVAYLSSGLKPVSHKAIQHGYENIFDNYYHISRNRFYCLECGHKWSNEALLVASVSGCTCPNCNKELKWMECKQSLTGYYNIITVSHEFQVIRYIMITKAYGKLGTPSTYWYQEVMQHWINENGKVTIMSKSVQGLSRYYDLWIPSSKLEIRPHKYSSNARYSITPDYIYPRIKSLDIIKRNGFKNDFYGMLPTMLFEMILTNTKYEVLLKKNQIELFKSYREVDNDWLWRCIKICLKHNYIITDYSIWKDYVTLLKEQGKDIHNPKYVCPDDLKKQHDKYVAKDQKIRLKRKIEELKKDIDINQIEYEKKKSKFFDVIISDNNISIQPLKHVQEFLIHGDILNHCIFSNKYFKKDESLILSANVDNKPVETIEIDLNQLKITQCRGRFNKETEYHNDIIKLLNNNMNLIKKCKLNKAI